jgi:pilus assembly protein Flp/PilA
MRTIIARFRKDVSGATAIEYGLIAGLISVVIIGGVTLAGTEIQALFTTIQNSLTGVGTGG